MQSDVRDSIFVSYSRRDLTWLDELKTALVGIDDGSRLRMWDDTRVSPAERWRDEIDEALSTAAAAVLLLSPHFFASSFIAEYELPPLLEAAGRGEIRLFAVVIAACRHERVTATFQVVNNPARPLESLDQSGRQSVWNRLLGELRGVVNGIDEETQIAAEMFRLRNDLDQRPEVHAMNEKIARAGADPDLVGHYRENALCVLEGQRCQLLATALLEEMQRPSQAALGKAAIARSLKEVARKDTAAQQRATELTGIFANQVLETLDAARRSGDQRDE